MEKKIGAIIGWLLLSAVTALAQQVSIANVSTLPIAAGEAQSTVVPPGKKSQCKQGRFLVTNDGARPPAGVVSGRNLEDSNGPVVNSIFDMGALSPNYSGDFTKSRYLFGTNDHDLVTLSNGDVLYITGAFSRMGRVGLIGVMPQGGDGEGVSAKNPPWFADTYRDICITKNEAGACTESYPFGPGARSVVLVWRSTDCGENFKYVSQMDPLRIGDGSCALPQFRRLANGNIINAKPYDMGGTDGQLVKVDPTNDRLYLTFQCVGFEGGVAVPPGYQPPPLNTIDPNAPPPVFPFKLTTKPLNKTLVMASYNQGTSWQNLGFINQAAWRFSVIPDGDDLNFGYASSVLFGRKNAGGAYDFDATGIVAPNGGWSWFTESDIKGNKNIPTGQVYVNVFAQPLLTRTPDSKSLVLAFPDVISANTGHGYRVFFYDRAAQKLVETNPILPAKQTADNVAFHLVAVDPGKGPVLLYWNDLDSAAKTITIRGRIITGQGQYTNDFTISQSMGAAASFNLGAPGYWFGDYQTAGGFVSEFAPSQGQGALKAILQQGTYYNFYPMWIEPDGTVRYTRVSYTTKTGLLNTLGSMANAKETSRQVSVTTIPLPQWKSQSSPVPFAQIHRPAAEREMTSEPDTRPRVRTPLRVIPRIQP